MISIKLPCTLRVALPYLATLAILAPLTWMWHASRVPAAYSVTDMATRTMAASSLISAWLATLATNRATRLCHADPSPT